MDTIELLEAIGSDAELRCAPPDRLVKTLARQQASADLLAAVRGSNRAPLDAARGAQRIHPVHSSQTGIEEFDEPARRRDAPPAPVPAPPAPSNPPSDVPESP